MPHSLLNVGDHLPGIGLIPAPVQLFRNDPKLDHQIGGQVLRFDFATLFLPEPNEGGFVAAHDDPGVGAADKRSAINLRCFSL